MAKKKQKNNPRNNKGNAMKRGTRLRHGALWVQNYSGNHLVRDYRKKFHVDPTQTLRDLHELSAIDDAKYEQMSVAEEKRLAAVKSKKQANEVDIWEHSDDRFFFIAGYTNGGAAYGVTWEEMGLEPYEMPCDDMGERAYFDDFDMEAEADFDDHDLKDDFAFGDDDFFEETP